MARNSVLLHWTVAEPQAHFQVAGACDQSQASPQSLRTRVDDCAQAMEHAGDENAMARQAGWIVRIS
jgi:hypothetical protein